ncbi:MAG: ABC transporter permease subunit [Clostridia bacterium]|nr:ABC transporter permease subunit [Clostridia bacterium]
MTGKLDKWILPILSIFFIILLFLPTIPLLAWSISDGWTWPDLFPKSVTLEGFQYVLSPSSGAFKALMNTWMIAGLTALINIFIAIPAADAIGRYDFKGKKWIEIFLILPILVPPVVIVLGLHRVFLQIHLVDTFIGVVIVHVIPTLPYMIRAITSSYRNVSFQMEDQAKMLGANSFKRFFYIVLPQISPGIIAGTGLTFLISIELSFPSI